MTEAGWQVQPTDFGVRHVCATEAGLGVVDKASAAAPPVGHQVQRNDRNAAKWDSQRSSNGRMQPPRQLIREGKVMGALGGTIYGSRIGAWSVKEVEQLLRECQNCYPDQLRCCAYIDCRTPSSQFAVVVLTDSPP